MLHIVLCSCMQGKECHVDAVDNCVVLSPWAFANIFASSLRGPRFFVFCQNKNGLRGVASAALAP